MKVVITARDYKIDGCSAIDNLKKAGHDVIDYSEAYYSNSSSEEDVIAAIGDADAVISGLEPYTEYVIKHCKNLKIISRRGIGYDNVDISYCYKNNITIARTVGAVEGAVAEHVMAYILYYSRRIDLQNKKMQEGKWDRIMTSGAKNHVLGLVGFGGIGKEIARRAIPFGMKVIYYCRNPRESWKHEYGVEYRTLDELLAESDYVSINVPLTEETKDMFDDELISKMKQGSYLINIARGPIVDDNSLKRAIESKHLAGAAIDVFDREPCVDSVLLGVDNVILTPHTAPYTKENFICMNDMAAQNVIDYFNNCLNKVYQVI